ncbi:MAG: zf-HC2 domain-containing protein [Candidatus Binataceae bacterium]|nr:zf-HC2 domain-containing protein [Candidatus Binataceae bacterium]
MATGENNDRFDTLLTHRLRAGEFRDREQCCEAAALAAYYEHALSAAESDRIESHLAGCGACRAELAMLAQAATDALAVETGLRRWWFSAPVGFAIAGAIGVIVAVGLGREYYQQEAAQPMRLAMQSAPATSPALSVPKLPAAGSPISQAPARVEVPRRRQPALRRFAAERMRASSPPPLGTSAALSIPQLAASAPGPAAAGAAISHSAGIAAPGAGTMAAASGGALSEGVQAESSRARPVPYFAKPGWAHGSTVSPDGSVRWTYGSKGQIARYVTNAATFVRIPGVTSDLNSASAPSASVCWIVGNGGTVLRTVDGNHWAAINSPSSANLVSVRASSADAAIVTATDGIRYATSDGGHSWQIQ